MHDDETKPISQLIHIKNILLSILVRNETTTNTTQAINVCLCVGEWAHTRPRQRNVLIPSVLLKFIPYAICTHACTLFNSGSWVHIMSNIVRQPETAACEI